MRKRSQKAGRDNFALNVKEFFPPYGKEFFPLYGKEFFPPYGKEFFPLCGKEFFPLYGKEFFPLCGKEFFPLYGKEFFPPSSDTEGSDKREHPSRRLNVHRHISGCRRHYRKPPPPNAYDGR